MVDFECGTLVGQTFEDFKKSLDLWKDADSGIPKVEQNPSIEWRIYDRKDYLSL